MQDNELKKSMDALIESNRKLGSVWWNLLRGITYGFGVFIGTVMLTALLIYVLGKIEGWQFIGRYAHNIVNILSQSSK